MKKMPNKLPRCHDFLSDIGSKLFPPSHRFFVVFIVFPLANVGTWAWEDHHQPTSEDHHQEALTKNGPSHVWVKSHLFSHNPLRFRKGKLSDQRVVISSQVLACCEIEAVYSICLLLGPGFPDILYHQRLPISS